MSYGIKLESSEGRVIIDEKFPALVLVERFVYYLPSRNDPSTPGLYHNQVKIEDLDAPPLVFTRGAMLELPGNPMIPVDVSYDPVDRSAILTFNSMRNYPYPSNYSGSKVAPEDYSHPDVRGYAFVYVFSRRANITGNWLDRPVFSHGVEIVSPSGAVTQLAGAKNSALGTPLILKSATLLNTNHPTSPCSGGVRSFKPPTAPDKVAICVMSNTALAMAREYFHWAMEGWDHPTDYQYVFHYLLHVKGDGTITSYQAGSTSEALGEHGALVDAAYNTKDPKLVLTIDIDDYY